MANRYFGNIGDIWKHLPLAEILTIERPHHYWESHAGSAQYPLTHSMERDYGVFYFTENAAESPILSTSVYLSILKSFKQNGQLMAYPGSPLIAMNLLRYIGETFLFCDIDSESLVNIRVSASEIGIPDEIVRTEHRDGISVLAEAASKISFQQASQIVVQIDPFDPFEKSENGLNSIELFCYCSKQGFKTVFWYCYESYYTREKLIEKVREYFVTKALSLSEYSLWCGDISLITIDNPAFEGLLGCGILCSNLSEKSIVACNNLGKALSKIYETAKLPSGQTGAIRFSIIPL